jgi:hypothetical protein
MKALVHRITLLHCDPLGMTEGMLEMAETTPGMTIHKVTKNMVIA